MPGMPLRRIVVLTGAGISAESGLRTFRDAGGLWENHRVEEVATPEAFAAHPDLVHRFYNERRRQLSTVGPNAAHLALARLEAALGDRLLLVTQNVDDLHERAGSRAAVHMHGELRRIRCSACGAVVEYDGDSSPAEACSGCGSPGTLRPHVVWFGEMPLELEKIFEALERCDLFAAVGTSGNVYPAAGFVQVARESGARTVEINLEPSEVSAHFDEARIGPAGLEVPRWVEELLGAAEEWGQS